jgi:hypothetical protein
MWSKVSVMVVAAALAAAPGLVRAQTAPSPTDQSQTGQTQPPPTPPLPVEPSISLHGFADLSFKNDYITPRGLRVTSKGETMQALDGLVLDFAQDPKGLITDVSVSAGTWMDWNPGYRAPNTQAFNEIDWFVGANVKLGKDWTAGVQYVEFISPQNAYETERNTEFSLAFDDSSYLKTVTFHPYVKLFYAMSGGSTVAVGRAGGTFDVEIGAAPTIDLHPYNIPLIVSAPTWVTVGPESFWGGGGNAGVFSTGIKVAHPIAFLPSTAGHWSVYASYQYYHFINNQLVLAEYLLNGRSNRDANLFQIGLSLGF